MRRSPLLSFLHRSKRHFSHVASAVDVLRESRPTMVAFYPRARKAIIGNSLWIPLLFVGVGW